MKKGYLFAAASLGGAAFVVAFTPLNAYARSMIAYVTLQSGVPGTPDAGHINVTGQVKAETFVGDGSQLQHVKASSLITPFSQTAVNNSGPLVTITNSGSYGAITATGGNAGIIGSSRTGYGVEGFTGSGGGPSSAAVFGSNAATADGIGVQGISYSASGWPEGVSGVITASNGAGVFGAGGGGSSYGVYSNGTFVATGTKNFQIDDPIDPENYVLNHYCSEGPEPLNVYSGNIVTDGRGYATVALPEYFASINRDFRYQLTVIDGGDDFVLAKVSKEIAGNQFTVRTSAPNVKVSWRVEGVRNDRWVQRYGAPVRVAKPEWQRGKYLRPELFNLPSTYSAFGPPVAVKAGIQH